MKLAVAQLISTADKHKNLEKALTVIAEARMAKADLVVLPETYMAKIPSEIGKTCSGIAEPLDGPFIRALKVAAKLHGIFVACGVYEASVDDAKRAYNTVVLINDDGELILTYRKTHLYDAFSYSESTNIIPGENGFEVVETRHGKIGLLVCYELRFPEISRSLALKGADIILVPTAWVAGPMKEEHLLTLAKSRALENTVFLCVADQVGGIYAGRSVICNPMGVTMASLGEDEGIIYAEIDLAKAKEIRSKLPCLTQRRPELYTLN